MKTQILQLEGHDDIVSTRDKMTWANGGRILIVWPSHGNLLSHKLDLVLLQRHSEDLGARLGLVTRDRQVLEIASELDIPTYRSVERARRYAWRSPARKARRSFQRKYQGDLRQMRSDTHPNRIRFIDLPVVRFLVFCLGVFSVAALMAVLLPSARVQIALASQPQQISLDITARPESTISIVGSIQYSIRRVNVSGSEEAEASGWINGPGDQAEGVIEFTNLTDQPVTIPAGTIILSPGNRGIRFQTTGPLELPARPGIKNTVPIKSLEGGKNGNLPAGQITSIEGILGLLVASNNPRPTTGGSDVQMNTASGEDLKLLEESLRSILKSNALDQMQAALREDEVLIPESLAVGRILERQVTPPEGSPGDRVRLKLVMEFEAAVYRQSDLETAAATILNAGLPTGLSPLPNTLVTRSLTVPASVSGESGVFTWQVIASQMIASATQEQDVITRVLGRNRHEAIQALKQVFPSIQFLDIQTSPGWWPLLPSLPFRIEVQDINFSPGGGGQG